MENKIIKYQKKIISVLVLIVLFCGLFLIGVIFNTWVQKANGGKMPFKLSIIYEGVYSYSDDTHFSYTDNSEVKYPILTDIIKTPFGIASLGDFFMVFFGLFIFLMGIYLVFLSVELKRLEYGK